MNECLICILRIFAVGGRSYAVHLFKNFNKIVVVRIAYKAADFLDLIVCIPKEGSSFFASFFCYVLDGCPAGLFFEDL